VPQQIHIVDRVRAGDHARDQRRHDADPDLLEIAHRARVRPIIATR